MFILFEKEYLAESFTEFALDIDTMIYFGKQNQDSIYMLNEGGQERVVGFKDEESRDKYWKKIMSVVAPSMPPCLHELLNDLKNHPEKLTVTKFSMGDSKKKATKKVVKKKAAVKKPLIIKPVKKKVAKKK